MAEKLLKVVLPLPLKETMYTLCLNGWSPFHFHTVVSAVNSHLLNMSPADDVSAGLPWSLLVYTGLY